jgi:hypothetical protein
LLCVGSARKQRTQEQQNEVQRGPCASATRQASIVDQKRPCLPELGPSSK